jgi:hypothetical protein
MVCIGNVYWVTRGFYTYDIQYHNIMLAQILVKDEKKGGMLSELLPLLILGVVE